MRPNLIEIYASTNHAIRVNWDIDCYHTNEFCKIEENKVELIDSLKTLIKTVEENYPAKE